MPLGLTAFEAAVTSLGFRDLRHSAAEAHSLVSVWPWRSDIAVSGSSSGELGVALAQ